MKATEFQGTPVLKKEGWRDWVGLTRGNEFCFRPWPGYLGTRRNMPWAYVVSHILLCSNHLFSCSFSFFSFLFLSFFFHLSEADSVIAPAYAGLTSWREVQPSSGKRNTSWRAFLPLSFLSNITYSLGNISLAQSQGKSFFSR